MCRVTTDTPPSFVRKRSSLSRSNSNASTTDETVASTTASDSIRKRVSFNEQVKVYPSERLSTSELGDVFYRPADYRRFRSDKCLEILDQQQLRSHLSPLSILFQRVAGAVRMRSLRKRCQQHSSPQASPGKPAAMEYPWMEPYYPQEAEESINSPSSIAPAPAQPLTSEKSNAAVLPATREAFQDSPEVRTIQELAFLL